MQDSIVAQLQSQAHWAGAQYQLTKANLPKEPDFLLGLASFFRWTKHRHNKKKRRRANIQQGVWQNTGRRKPCFIVRFIVHLYIQLDIKNLAVEYIIIFLSLLSSS
jgi:hypothetical protein